jgi:hypothetical protein
MISSRLSISSDLHFNRLNRVSGLESCLTNWMCLSLKALDNSIFLNLFIYFYLFLDSAVFLGYVFHA